ncbi:hypothetical protein ACW5R3_01220 [Bizionia sp. KMM 8389]
MKQNTILYILLIFLVVANGFFLYNFMGPHVNNREKGKQDPLSFIAKQLDFDGNQLEQMKQVNEEHHLSMKHINDELKGLKDNLFIELSNVSLERSTVDSLTSLIGENQKKREIEVFYHLKSIREICTEKQRNKFEAIIKQALRNDINNNPEGQRPPPEGQRPPPRN